MVKKNDRIIHRKHGRGWVMSINPANPKTGAQETATVLWDNARQYDCPPKELKVIRG